MKLCSYPLLLLLAGCATPTALPPVVPVVLAPAFGVSGATALPDRWWESFQDPDLASLVEQALTNNFSLRAAWDRLAQAEAVARKSGAALVPEIEAKAKATRARARAGDDTRYQTQFTLGWAASYELDLWGRVRSARDAAALDAQASREELRAAAITLSAQVATTWYQAIEQAGQVALLQEQLRTNEQMLELVTLQFRQGRVRAEEVLRQRQLVEARRGDLATAQARATVLANQLAVLVGERPGAVGRSLPADAAGRMPIPPLPATGIPAEWLQQRPDIRQAWLAVAAADRRVAAAVAEQFPKLTLAGTAETTAGRARELFDNWLATMAANLVAPVWDGGKRRAEVARARAAAAERWHDYGQKVLTGLAEVEDALAQQQRQGELAMSLARQLELAGQIVERTRDSYRNGTADYLRVLEALQTQQALQRSELQARRQWCEYCIQLCRALAGGWKLSTEAND